MKPTYTVDASGVPNQEAPEAEGALTTAQGVRVADDQNSLSAGARGPTLLEDFILREKITHFDHERIPERVVHARGYGAKGFFEAYPGNEDLTKAGFLQSGTKTEVFCRFSTVAGNKGSADTARDVRGFSVKFYTTEGNYDLVGNNIPVFFIQDAIKFPDLIHSVKPEPDRGFPQAQSAHDTFWDFVSLSPESIHMLTWVMSDRAIPRSFRTMEGFGVHTFRMINEAGDVKLVKFHWKPVLPAASLVWSEAQALMGADPDFHRRDLWNALASGDHASWELGVQVFDDDFADRFEFDVLDATKLIPEEIVPVRTLGKMTLDQNVSNFFAETEQVAFCPSHLVPGIDFSNDPLLQGRLHSYLDTQLKRLGGPNFHEIPVNRPRCPYHTLQQDGHMRMRVPEGRVRYEPSSLDDGTVRQHPSGFHSSDARRVEGTHRRTRPETFADHYSQARQFYRSQTAIEQQNMQAAFAFELGKVDHESVRLRMLGHLKVVDESLADGVARRLGHPLSTAEAIEPAVPPRDLDESPALSLYRNRRPSAEGRRVGVFLSDGADAEVLDRLESALSEAGAKLAVVAPQRAGAVLSDGKRRSADEAAAGGPSVLFDAVVVLTTGEVPDAALRFVDSAFRHGKAIGFTDASRAVIEAAGITPSPSVTAIDETPESFIEALAAHRDWGRLESL